MPHIIRRLEAAQPGDVAQMPGGYPCALKMSDSGTPWLLDPWAHRGRSRRVTTYTLAQMGYQCPAYEPPPEPTASIEVNTQAARGHLEDLLADGWTLTAISKASGLAGSTLKRARRGAQGLSPEAQARLFAVQLDPPVTPKRLTARERMEDMEWLMAGGVPPHLAAERCGYASLSRAIAQSKRAGRPDLAERLTKDPLYDNQLD